VAKTNNSSENGTLYVTMSPCIECSKLIIQAGIKRVVFAVLYSNHEGLVLLERAGVEVIHLTDDNE
jgi:dCMP deaminase